MLSSKLTSVLAGSDTANESSSPSLADIAQLEKDGGVHWMLGERDVIRIGEALLHSLLALKHMGCVAFAQVRQREHKLWPLKF